MYKSFFDNQDQGFWSPRKIINNCIPIIEGLFYVPTKSVDQYDLISLKLQGKCLIMKDGITEIYADIENACIIRVEQKGICLIKNQIEFQFYGDVDDFFINLKQYCIQSDFQSKYHLLSVIGQGNYAKVFKARNKHNLAENAVKVFDKSSFSQITDRLALVKEIHILRQLSHSNIIQLHEVFETKTQIYLVFDYLSGGDLTNFINTKQLVSEEEAKTIMMELLNALLYMHSKGIFHRDIKPQNLLLRKKGQITDLVIADLGLADYYRRDGKYMFTRCGTPGYVAPEILLDNPYDFKIDIYSLGALLYVMLTGKPLFKGATEQETVQLNTDNNLDFSNTSLSKPCIDLLKNMLNKNPLFRFSISQCKSHEWFQQDTQPIFIRLRHSMKSKLQFNLDLNSEDSSPCSPKKSQKLFKIKTNLLSPRLSGSSTSSFERQCKQSRMTCKTEPSEQKSTFNKLKLSKQRQSQKY
ncbi:unnamed protein product [Paramecium pentaurelia]|uniref:non-specific serine/threonine protein kinase n=1 Tax=Paramecium pentaurelia TaxID=43138 RepID=A0A8S1U0J9_9CILI|nr:unnamed protein product [Paramecium pentaurelia]